MGELDPRIRIRAPLRCDGIGRLDCAEDSESGLRLAVRWLPLEANGDAAVKACARLPQHPTLPHIRQIGQVGSAAFVAMDFPEGKLLSTMAGDRLDLDLVLRLAAQLSDALATVHEQGMVHGELSAESVLLVPPDRAYLWDMPLVVANRLTDRRGESRLMQNLVKSAAFLAPERARGCEASREGDVYALGVVLCTAAGAPLPTASSTLGVINLVSTGEWQPRVPSTIPDPYHELLQRMVSPEQALRPTAREVARVFTQVPVPASLPTVPEFPAVRLPPRPTLEVPMVVPAEARPSVPSPSVQVVPELTVATAEACVLPSQAPTAPRDAAPPSQPDAPNVPTLEIPAQPAGEAATVRLSDSISVTPELVLAGARAVTLDLPKASARLAKKPSAAVFLVAAAFLALVAVLTVAAVNLATKPAGVVPGAAPVLAAPTPGALVVPKPAPVLASSEEELAPTPTAPPRTVAPVVAPRPSPKTPAAPQAAAPAGTSAQKATGPDFSFLDNLETGEKLNHSKL